MTKVCSKCKTEKSLEEFGNHKGIPSGKQSSCKNCLAELARLYRKNYKERHKATYTKWRRNNPDKLKEAAKIRKLKQYNLTKEEYNNLIKLQNNLCALCEKKEDSFDSRLGVLRNLAIDHCHKTGKVRGLLCTNCNNGLGRFKDSIELLQKAIDYLYTSGSKRKVRV